MSELSSSNEQVRTCPDCSRQHPRTVEVCVCGHRFKGEPAHPLTGTVGLWLVGLGAALALWAMFLFDTSVGPSYERLENIGLLQRQLMFFQAGIAIALAGTALFAADIIRRALPRQR